ncbi:MAG: hypothetical protein KGI73_04990 [Patescibacteria group bacterium]|nr:hypothetical protein [Patescibacteria group bacterium]
MTLPRRFKIFAVFVVIVAASYGATRLWSSNGGVPTDFQSARLQGSLIAQDIVNISNQSDADLEKVNQLDQSGKYAEALAIVTQAANRSQDIRDKAVELSDQISKMTASLSGISSLDARQAALEAISSRLALLNQLISYSNDLSKLLDALRGRFAGESNPQNIAALVENVNAEVRAVNAFNSQAGQAMDRFDKIMSGGK